MKKLTFCTLLCLLTVLAMPAKASGGFYTSVTELLQAHVRQGQVNYSSLRQQQAQLQRVLRQVATYDLSKASNSARKAFYINAYNLLVLQQVLEHYPLQSVMDVKGFFDEKTYMVAGERLTLNELEKQKLLKPYPDARLHFALVCAAKSCPPLRDTAYTPAEVEQQLQDQAERTLQSSTFIKTGKGQVLVSEILKWYADDFLQEAPSLLAYINRYRKNKIPANTKLSYYTYNWALNDVPNK